LLTVLLPLHFIFLVQIVSCKRATDIQVTDKTDLFPGKLRDIDTSLFYKRDTYSLKVHLFSFGPFGYRMSAITGHNDSITSQYDFTFDYPVYHFELGDVNGDGNVDICLGVIKPTRFDSTPRKRLFLYKLDEGRIRPLWLGSRVSHELIDFRYVQKNDYSFIRTVEREKNGNYLVANYQSEGFGLAITNYISRNTNKEAAYETFNQL
jgi:hypothetical protein